MKKIITTVSILAVFLIAGMNNVSAQSGKTNDANSNKKTQEIKPAPAPAASSRVGSAGEYKGAAFGDPARVGAPADTTKNKINNPTKQPAKSN